MSGPDRIWIIKDRSKNIGGHKTPLVSTRDIWTNDPNATEYIRRDPGVLAALPEVQALIAAEREACLNVVIEEAEYQLDVSKTQFARGMSWGATDWARRSLNAVAAAIRKRATAEGKSK